MRIHTIGALVLFATLLPAADRAAGAAPEPDAGDDAGQLDCTVNGVRSRATLARADFSVDPSGTSGHFRVLAKLPAPTAPGSDDGPMLQLMALDVRAPGAYPVSLEPTWRSLVSRDGRDAKVTGGKWSLSSFSFRGVEHVAGRVSFTAPGYTGECSFALPMTVIDIGALRRR